MSETMRGEIARLKRKARTVWLDVTTVNGSRTVAVTVPADILTDGEIADGPVTIICSKVSHPWDLPADCRFEEGVPNG